MTSGASSPGLTLARDFETNTAKVWLVADPSHYKDNPTKLPKETKVDILEHDGPTPEFNDTEDEYKWVPVRVISGDHKGEEGWIMRVLLDPQQTTPSDEEVQEPKLSGVGDTDTDDSAGDGFVRLRVGQDMNVGSTQFSVKNIIGAVEWNEETTVIRVDGGSKVELALDDQTIMIISGANGAKEESLTTTYQEAVDALNTAVGFDLTDLNDLITCLCGAGGYADLVNKSSKLVGDLIGGFDCLCNILTAVQELFKRVADGDTLNWGKLLEGNNIIELLALFGLAAADCALDLASLVNPGAGAIKFLAKDLVVDFVGDLTIMGTQNLITQDTPLPKSQCQACEDVFNGLGLSLNLGCS